ncbi:MAG: aspartate aminotransferase family protein [Piscinibacter sp.]|uniref:aspartate aminotransferase family protein n=1 Tax=Piscinibacter sp. TaxID=1903157 RepID=UPI003D0BDC91
MTTADFRIDHHALAALHAQETQRFIDTHPRSVALSGEDAAHYLFGVPLHWMRDWPTPATLHVQRAEGNRLWCADGHEYLDFCLGDTGAMFGHSPAPVARAIAAQAQRGLTAMLPSTLTSEVGRRLAECFGLPRWQVTLSASDANRFVLRWARAVTGRRKVLVFDGCYHGTVDDTLVDMDAQQRTITRASLLGQVHDLALGTVVVPFTDIAAVEAALARGDVACVLTEPALTNCGLVPPQPGFLAQLQAACRRHAALFVLDETHTVSSGWGGHARVEGLSPDFIVVGKAVAGGLPCAVYGFTEAMNGRMETAKHAAPDGHSGIGTTLSANLLAMAALHASLGEVMTAAAYDQMLATAAAVEARLRETLQQHGAPWTVTRLGARMELQFCTEPPANAVQARAAMDEGVERALHLWLLNRGIVITPFHNMLLVSPQTRFGDAQPLVTALGDFLSAVRA